MKVISLGYTCYIKSLIQETDYAKETDIFDWINSFEFNKIIKSIDNKFNIFDNIIKSPLDVDLKSYNIYFNEDYSFRIPHEINLDNSRKTYTKRFERFINYKNDSNNYLFIREINRGRYNIKAECLENNYNEENYSKIISYLPINSKILLITNEKLSSDDKIKISKFFYVIDDVISPQHIAFGDFLQHKTHIIKCYNNMFNYICNNFDNFDIKIAYDFIKNTNITDCYI
jgi:hypothetical protein